MGGPPPGLEGRSGGHLPEAFQGVSRQRTELRGRGGWGDRRIHLRADAPSHLRRGQSALDREHGRPSVLQEERDRIPSAEGVPAQGQGDGGGGRAQHDPARQRSFDTPPQEDRILHRQARRRADGFEGSEAEAATGSPPSASDTFSLRRSEQTASCSTACTRAPLSAEHESMSSCPEEEAWQAIRKESTKAMVQGSG